MQEYFLRIKPATGRRTFSYEILENIGPHPWVVRVGSMCATEAEAKNAGEAALRWFRAESDE